MSVLVIALSLLSNPNQIVGKNMIKLGEKENARDAKIQDMRYNPEWSGCSGDNPLRGVYIRRLDSKHAS